jgi:hypothetical protein
MKYRIQVTVSGDRLAAIIDAAFKGAQWDPDLKVWPVEEVAAIEPPKKAAVGIYVSSGEILHGALKTGPKRWGELRQALGIAGFAESSLNGLIAKWRKEGKIRSDGGLWSLNDAQAAHAG